MRRRRRGPPTPTSMARRSISRWPRSESRPPRPRGASAKPSRCFMRYPRRTGRSQRQPRRRQPLPRRPRRPTRRCSKFTTTSIAGAADLPRRSGRTLSAGRRAAARLARASLEQRELDAGLAAHAAHVQGQRADGGAMRLGELAHMMEVATRPASRRPRRDGRSCSTRWTTISTTSLSCSIACSKGETDTAAAVAWPQRPKPPASSRRRRATSTAPSSMPLPSRAGGAAAPPARPNRRRPPRRDAGRARMLARARRPDRPAGERGRRGRDNARPRRGRAALAEGAICSS